MGVVVKAVPPDSHRLHQLLALLLRLLARGFGVLPVSYTHLFVPDTPAVVASVVYCSVAISLANLLVDILYTFIDPRIKTQLKDY